MVNLVHPTPQAPRARTGRPGGRAERDRGRSLLALLTLTVLLCLIPKPENDLFFELRTGTDILHTGHLPHADPYSWTRHGVRWDVPEWGAFLLYALAYHLARFFGVWLLMTALALLTATILWRRARPHVGPAGAAALSALTMLAVSPCLQERPYAFTYPLMAVALILLARGRAGRPRALLALVPLCALWTNLHQGVLAFVCLALAAALGDALTAARRRWQNAQSPLDLLTPEGRDQAARREADPDSPHAHAARARLMLVTALLCAAAALTSPYGWGVYRSVYVTLDDPAMTSHVTEWDPITVLPASQLPPFALSALLAAAALILSPRRTLAEALMLAGLFAESLLHARQSALFALAAAVIIAPHLPAALGELRRRRLLPAASPTRRTRLAAFTLLGLLCAAAATLTGLRRAAGPLGLTPEGIGQAVARVPTYPAAACDYLDRHDPPPTLRLLNNFEIGGYLLWRHRPDFIDGRLDLYTGPPFADALLLTRAPGSPAGLALLRKYRINAVLTTDPRQAAAFNALPAWRLAYADPPTLQSPHASLFFLSPTTQPPAPLEHVTYGLNPIFRTSGESQLLPAQVSLSSSPQTPSAANSRGWNGDA